MVLCQMLWRNIIEKFQAVFVRRLAAACPPVLRRGSIAAVPKGNDGGRGTLPRPATGLSTLARINAPTPRDGGQDTAAQIGQMVRPPCPTKIVQSSR